MDAQQFYRPIPEKLCQGDVFERVPLLHLKELPPTLKRVTLPGNREGFELTEPLSAEAPPKVHAGLLVPALVDHTRGILLTYDCEIDKPGVKHLTVALVRPLDPLPDDQKELLRQGRSFAYFHLPAAADGGSESYVDFRRLATLSVEIVQSSKRVASLSEIAWQALLFQFIRFFSRVEVDRKLFNRPE